jgi:uncharacterized protein (TIRG00374 family)
MFKFLLEIFKVNLNYKEWFGLSVCNTMFNYYLPARGGLVVRAYYLKQKYNFPFSHYASLLTATYIIAFFLSGTVGIFSTILYKFFHGILLKKLLLIFTLLLLCTFVLALLTLLFAKLRVTLKHERINNIFQLIQQGFDYFFKNWQVVIYFSMLHILFLCVSAARLYVSFYAIGIEVVSLQMLIIVSLVNFTLLLTLTPGNLGIREGVISFCAYLYGIPPDIAILAALIDRAAEVVLTFVLGLTYSRILLLDIQEVNKNFVYKGEGRGGEGG